MSGLFFISPNFAVDCDMNTYTFIVILIKNIVFHVITEQLFNTKHKLLLNEGTKWYQIMKKLSLKVNFISTENSEIKFDIRKSRNDWELGLRSAIFQPRVKS